MTNKSIEAIERKSIELQTMRHDIETHLSKENTPLTDLTPTDIEKLFHALHTYQVELEMQNEELRRVQGELVDSRDRYSDLYDFLPVGCLVIDGRGAIVEANLTIAEMLQIERGILKGQWLSCHVCGDSQDKYYHHRQEILEKSKSSTVEIELKRSDGTQFFVELKSWAMNEPNSQQYWRTAVIDISDRKQAEKEKANLELQLQHGQKMETLGTLAAGIAHDFNNILTPIFGGLELAIMDLSPDSARHKSLEAVLNSATRAANLVDQILVFGGKAQSGKKSALLQDTIQEALSLLRATFPSTIEIIDCIEIESEPVIFDPTQIHQIVMNLGTNAYRAIGNTGGTISISLDELRVGTDSPSTTDLKQDDYFRLVVRDTGCGMTQAIIERLFDPFYTNWPTAEGTGLGLSVVHGIVNGHGGTISAKSDLGRGSEFTVHLPKIISLDTPHATEIDSDIPNGTERILIVDDQEAVAQSNKKMLELLGYQVSISTDSQSALEMFRKQPSSFDLVVSDQTMPGLTGLQLAKELHAIRPGINIVLVSGFSDAVTPESIEDAGIAFYLQKPFRLRKLGSIMRQVLDRR